MTLRSPEAKTEAPAAAISPQGGSIALRARHPHQPGPFQSPFVPRYRSPLPGAGPSARRSPPVSPHSAHDRARHTHEPHARQRPPVPPKKHTTAAPARRAPRTFAPGPRKIVPSRTPRAKVDPRHAHRPFRSSYRPRATAPRRRLSPTPQSLPIPVRHRSTRRPDHCLPRSRVPSSHLHPAMLPHASLCSLDAPSCSPCPLLMLLVPP